MKNLKRTQDAEIAEEIVKFALHKSKFEIGGLRCLAQHHYNDYVTMTYPDSMFQ